MRQLLDFLVRKRHWILFILLEILSLMLIYQNNAYQRSVIISSANTVTGSIASASGFFTSYFGLRSENQDLLERNGQLEIEVLALQEKLAYLTGDSTKFTGYSPNQDYAFSYDFIRAAVVNNSVTHLANYITINKGRKDGIQPDMGVVSNQGVVGIVSNVSDHYAVIISLLNPKSRLSGVIKGDFFGSINWNGRNPRYVNLDEVARHAEFQRGDTVVTSGYSSIFPAGIVIGTITNSQKQQNDNFLSLEVELATDFYSLKNVRVIRNFNQSEQQRIEQEAKGNDT